MDAVSRSPKYLARRAFFSLACTLVLIQNGAFPPLLQAATPPKSDAASSATDHSGVGRASVGFEPSETIVVRGGKAVRLPEASNTARREGPYDVRNVLLQAMDVRSLPGAGLNLVSGQVGIQLPESANNSAQDLELFPSPNFEETPDAKEPAVSQERRDHVRHIIRGIRPNADPDTIDIWIEQFASLPDGNIEFLVTQSSLLKGESQLPSIPDGSSELNVDRSQRGTLQSSTDLMIQPAANRSRTESNDVVSRNLANVMTVGYREELELKAASPSVVPGLRRLAVFHHGTGPSIVTGSPLHLAIQTSGAVFFQLEDGRLTRNGMFERLDDGRIGITEGDSVAALNKSPVLAVPENVLIRSDGSVFEDGKRIGMISVATVRQPELLSTEDGVYFQTGEEVASATEIELQAGSLELSNVDVPRNRYLQFAHRP